MKKVPETHHLLTRGGAWYYHRRVPKSAQSAIGKKVLQFSLGSSKKAAIRERERNPSSQSGGPVDPSPSPERAPDRPKPKGRLGHLRVMRAAFDDDTMLDAERKASPFCAERAIVVNGLQK
jgi:hypothetical protein